MHTLLKKTISIFAIMGLFFSLFSNAITPLSQVFAAEVCTTKTVQGWTVDTVDITDANFTLSYNGEIWHNSDYTSLADIVKDANTIFQQHHDKDGTPLYSLTIQDNTIYITESDINPLDIKTDVIEIQLYDNSASSSIIVDKDNTDGGYNEGLLYNNIDIKECKTDNTTTCTTVQGWKLHGSDFSSPEGVIYYNGEKIGSNIHTDSIENMIIGFNNVYKKYSDERGIIGLTFAYDNAANIIYIMDSNNNPLDPKADTIEIRISNTNDNSEILGDKNQEDGGYSEGLLYSTQKLSDCTTPPTDQCTVETTVQGWILEGVDFSNITFYGSSNNGHTLKQDFTSKADLLQHLNTNFAPKAGIDRTFEIKENLLYIVDSNKNSLDSSKFFVEFAILNRNDDSMIINPSDNDGGVDKDGLLYSNQKIAITTDNCNNTCTDTTVQGWTLTQTDFSNMEIIIQHNGMYILNKGGYISIEELLAELNKTYSEYAIKSDLDNKEFVYDTETNHIYIKDSNSNRLDAKTTMIEIVLINRNDDSLIIKKSDIDGGNFEGLIYSDIQICNQTTGEETCSSTKNVQGWLLNGNDFSNISLYASYNGKDIKTDVFSQKELLSFLNNDFAKSTSLNHTFNIIDNILYVVGSDNIPLMTDKEFIELNMFNNIDKIDIISTSEKDGGISRGLLYSNQNISDCNPETPVELDVPAFVCSHKMKGFDIALYSMNGNPSEIYFHGVEDDSTSEGKYVSTPVSQINNAEIQVFLNNIYGENKVIRYFNEDESIVNVRYDADTINPKNIYILMGDNKQASNKFNGGDRETTYNLCPIDKPLEAEITQKATCTPNLVTSSDQKIVCEFTVTNQGPGIAYDMTYNGIKLPNGFKIIDQGFPDVTSMDVGDSLVYKFVGTQSIFPKSGSETITIGDLDLTYYDNTKTEHDISMNTTIELKRPSRGHSSSSSSNVIEPIKSNPIITPTNTNTGTNNQSTGATMSSGTVLSSTGVTHNTGSANNIIIESTPTATGAISTGNVKPIVIEPIKEEIIQEIPIMELTQYCAYENPIPTNAWQDINTEYANDIKHLISKCIVNGLDNEMLYYGPHKVIKKAEVVKIVSKWFKLSIPKSTSDNRWEQYLSSMQINKALVGLEDTRNESTMNEGVKWEDVMVILKNINPDANLDLIKSFSTKRVSRQAFAHIITRQ